MSAQFYKLIDRVLSHEGGYSNDPRDPGNWTGGKAKVGKLAGTKFGISAGAYPDLDIKGLTRQRAIEIYKRDFWDAVDGDRLHPHFSFQALDAAVNHGVSRSIRWMQQMANVKIDGFIGPITHAALAAMDIRDMTLLFNAIRIEFYTSLSTWPTYGKGWTRRVATNLRYAAEDNDQ